MNKLPAVRSARTLSHPDIAHGEAILESNRRECVAIDKMLGKQYRTQSSTGLHSDVRDKKRYVAPTLHDRAQSNPLLRALMRDLQK